MYELLEGYNKNIKILLQLFCVIIIIIIIIIYLIETGKRENPVGTNALIIRVV